jgi:hypothetical protein
MDNQTIIEFGKLFGREWVEIAPYARLDKVVAEKIIDSDGNEHYEHIFDKENNQYSDQLKVMAFNLYSQGTMFKYDYLKEFIEDAVNVGLKYNEDKCDKTKMKKKKLTDNKDSFIYNETTTFRFSVEFNKYGAESNVLKNFVKFNLLNIVSDCIEIKDEVHPYGGLGAGLGLAGPVFAELDLNRLQNHLQSLSEIDNAPYYQNKKELSYNQLLEENERLKKELNCLKRRTGDEPND